MQLKWDIWLLQIQEKIIVKRDLKHQSQKEDLVYKILNNQKNIITIYNQASVNQLVQPQTTELKALKVEWDL
jgi:hypothetical protein